ncbi:50S ribosomal protein L19 [bacterium]|nr:50S ribosomal protein L19 [bacterium]
MAEEKDNKKNPLRQSADGGEKEKNPQANEKKLDKKDEKKQDEKKESLPANGKKPKISKQKNIIEPSEIKPGMVVKIWQKIKEKNPKGEIKERLQYFEGTVLARKAKNEIGATVTVRKISNGVGVEKIFPLSLPTITKVELLQKIKTRRAKLYFLRRGHKRRLKKVKAS